MPWKPAAGGSGHRPRTASKSIRGQISGPIPIPDPLDEEFPTRDQASAIANVADVNESIINDTGTADDQSAARHMSGSSGTRHSIFPDTKQDMPSSAAAHTSVSQKSSAGAPSQPGQTKTASDTGSGVDKRNSQPQSKPQRKKSTLRSALSKLFSRKNKNQTNGEDASSSWKTNSPGPRTAADKQHRSDPTGQKPVHISMNEPKRSFSMPITEYDRALRSHSIGPEDVLAIQSARNSLSAEMRLSGRYTGLFDSPTQPASPRWGGESKLAGLSPRPASSQDRTRIAGLNEDPGEIGRAISSDSQGLKRRSRSLTFMPSLDLSSASLPQGVLRRRSAEIRYWRESYAAPLMSPTSTTVDDEFMQLPTGKLEKSEQELEPQLVMNALVATPPPPPPAVPHPTREDEEIEQPQSKTHARSTDYFAGTIDPLCLDNRVSSLETRMSRLEGIVLQLGNSLAVLRQHSKETRPPALRQVQVQANNHAMNPILLQPAETGLVGEPRPSTSRPSTCHSDTSKMTFGDVGESTPRATIISPSTDDQGKSLSLWSQKRGSAESISKQSVGVVKFEHYTNLLALLETERSAREALEAQVRSLGRQLQLISKSIAYTNTDHSDSPSLNRSLGEVSVFDHDDDDDPRRLTATRYPYSTLGLDDSGIATENRSDDEYTESFVTPAETVKSSFDVFGNENDPTQSESLKLSMSHLTMRQPLSANAI